MHTSSKISLSSALLALLGAASLHPASAQISSFGSGFTLNANTNAQTSGLPAILDSGATLQLTDTKRNAINPDPAGYNGGSEAASAFYNTPQSVGAFTAQFTYQEDITGDTSTAASLDPADGFAFVLQNDTRGASALGDSGEVLGYGSNSGTAAISPSAAIEFNIYSGRTVGTNLATNGATQVYNATGAVNVASGDPILVNLGYDGTTLTETLTDQTTADFYSTSYATDLPGILGGSTAYVGFTGGTGGGVADQFIRDFSYTQSAPVPEASTVVSTGLLLVFGLGGLAVCARRRKCSTRG
jgi:hypothetical protein